MFSDTKQFVAHVSNAVGSTMPPIHALLTSMFSSRSFVLETSAVTVSVCGALLGSFVLETGAVTVSVLFSSLTLSAAPCSHFLLEAPFIWSFLSKNACCLGG